MMEEQITNDDMKKAPKTENVLIKSRPIRSVYNRTWRTSVLIITFHQKSSKAEGKPEGEIFNMHIPYGIPFCGVGDMMMKMDRIYDLLDYPQTELKIRQWDDTEEWKGTPLASDEGWNYGEDAAERFRRLNTGSHPAVYVETRFRRYGSWQGILQVGKRKLSYRSALEFLHYIMGYLENK